MTLAVALGAFVTFAAFAATTITNVPSVGTVITGDMGVYPGAAFTGFPPGEVTGSMYGAGSYAGLVKGDAQVAYLDAAGRAFDTTLTSSDLGGMTLEPGVYRFDNVAALSAGQLFFDAKGDFDAVWIIQVGTSLNIAGGSGMFFTGGVGDANKVYWQVGTSATLNTACAVVGNFLAYTSVSVAAAASVNGRLLGLNGAVTLSNNAVTVPFDRSPTGQPTSSPTCNGTSCAPTSTPSGEPSSDSGILENSSDGGDDDANVGMIAGIAVGAVVVVGAVAGGVYMAMTKTGGEAAGAGATGTDKL